MKRRARSRRVWVIALLAAGSTAPSVGLAHSEGVEAADPNTPPAVLTFDTAIRRYTALRASRADWHDRFADDEALAPGHADHAGAAAQHTPAARQ